MLIKGKRLYIRSFVPDDDDAYYDLAKNPHIGYLAGWKPHSSIKITRNVVSYFVLTNETFAICLKDSDEFIGTISLYSDTFRKNVVARDLGFSINEKFWGNGYAPEAVQMILKYAFDELNVEVVGVTHMTENIQSKRVIEKIGFTLEGLIRKYRKLYDDRIVDVLGYSMTREEYERKKTTWEKY